MRIRMGSGLLPLNLLTVVIIVVIFFLPAGALPIVLGTPFVLFFPGYVLMVALFPKREGMGGIERVALSCVISIAVVPLIGLFLYYTPWGISQESVLGSVASFIFITSIIAWFRWRQVSLFERFNIEFQVRMQGWGGGARGRALSVILGVAILGTFGILVYTIASPKVGENFSELYILGLEGKAGGYPTELAVGEVGRVMVGIINNERKTMSYQVEVRIDGVKNSEVGPIVLANEREWEETVAFIPQKAGDNQKVEFLLYRDEESEAYLTLRLWIDVSE